MIFNAVDPRSGVAQAMPTPEAMKAGLDAGFVPLHGDNTQAKVYWFEGGYLIDGAPLNVWYQGYWFEGQKEILRPFWESGQIVYPGDTAAALPSVPPTQEILANYAAFKGNPEAQTLQEAYAGGGGLASVLQSPMALVIGAGLLFLFVASSGKAAGAGASDGGAGLDF